VLIRADLTGLRPVTTYYYQAVASNSAGRSPGAILSFTTSSAAVSRTSRIGQNAIPWTLKRP